MLYETDDEEPGLLCDHLVLRTGRAHRAPTEGEYLVSFTDGREPESGLRFQMPAGYPGRQFLIYILSDRYDRGHYILICTYIHICIYYIIYIYTFI